MARQKGDYTDQENFLLDFLSNMVLAVVISLLIILFYFCSNFMGAELYRGANNILLGNFEGLIIVQFLVVVLVMFRLMKIGVAALLMPGMPYLRGANIFVQLWTRFKNGRKAASRLGFLIFALTVAILLVWSGIQFFKLSYPPEDLIIGGVPGTMGSNMYCGDHGRLHLIEEFGYICDLNPCLACNSTIASAFVRYRKNHTSYEYNASTLINASSVHVHFFRHLPPTHILINYSDNKSEEFLLHTQGVYSIKEYNSREQDKNWKLFGIFSAGLFAVFSFFSAFKHLLEPLR